MRPRAGLVAAVVATVVLVAGCGDSANRPTLAAGPDAAGASATSTTAAPSTTTAEATTTTTVPPTTTAAPTTTESPTTTAPPPTTTTAAPTTTTTAPPPVETITEAPGSLKSGSKGARTLALQQALKDQHYDPGEPDGKFGLKTSQAVWAYQALHNLPADGLVNPLLEAGILARQAQPMLRPALGPTHTEVDLSRQVLLVFRDNQLLLITHLSSGTGKHYCANTPNGRHCGTATTPTGVFRFIRRIKGIREADLGKLYDPVYFRGGYAVHGSPSVPNHPASHGCVRIPMSISTYFQGLVNDGDSIEVFRS